MDKEKEEEQIYLLKYKTQIVNWPPILNLLMLGLYHNRKMENVNKASRRLDKTYSYLLGRMDLLADLGLVKKTKEGRTNIYEITDSGDFHCVRLLDIMRGYNGPREDTEE